MSIPSLFSPRDGHCPPIVRSGVNFPEANKHVPVWSCSKASACTSNCATAGYSPQNPSGKVLTPVGCCVARLTDKDPFVPKETSTSPGLLKYGILFNNPPTDASTKADSRSVMSTECRPRTQSRIMNRLDMERHHFPSPLLPVQ